MSNIKSLSRQVYILREIIKRASQKPALTFRIKYPHCFSIQEVEERERKTRLKVSKIHLKFLEFGRCLSVIDPGHLVLKVCSDPSQLQVIIDWASISKRKTLVVLNYNSPWFERVNIFSRFWENLNTSDSASDGRMWERESKDRSRSQ